MSKRLAWMPIAALALALGSPVAVAQSGEASTGSSATAAGGARGGSSTTASPRDKAAVPPKPNPERTQRASRIIGMDVVNRHGQKIGDVEDILLDVDGSVTHAVVSTGGFLGMGNRLHAVPWRSLHRNAGTDTFLLDIDTDRLRSAPGFDQSSFPDFNDPKWSSENRKHFPAAGSATPGNSPARSSATAGTRASGGSTIDAPRTPGGTGAARSSSGNDIGPSSATSGRSGLAAGTNGRSGTSTTASDPGSTSATAPRAERRPPMPGSSATANPSVSQPGSAAGPDDQPVTGGGRDPAGINSR